MIEFVTVNDDDPALAHSPMVRAIGKTFAYIAENGISGRDLDRIFYDTHSKEQYNRDLASLYAQVLRPLIWTGLLAEHRNKGEWVEDAVFTKTSLWHAALRLDTDDMVKPAMRH